MKITPLDIRQQQFKGKMLGGLDPDDVDSFLQAWRLRDGRAAA
jgi:cell division initiation protein